MAGVKGRRAAPEPPGPRQYKVVETSDVTAEALTLLLNEWCGQGFCFEGMQFAMRESSRRPAMAFLLFTRAAPP